ncbi:MAG: ElyC/SanA/YdcF family protein [Syntrophomonas sp.]
MPKKAVRGDKKVKAGKVKYVLLALAAILVIAAMLVNWHVQRVGSSYICDAGQAPQADVILILGAYVLPDGTVSRMLNDRLQVGYELYAQGKAPKILVSGDHGRREYDEVNTMKEYIKNRGAAPDDVFMDHAGFSTYESMYRARDIFQAKKVIIVTQRYHLMRAVFIARELGLEAYGVASDLGDYGPVMYNYQLREIAARNKDFILAAIIKPYPTFLGEAIPVSGSGRATDDK